MAARQQQVYDEAERDSDLHRVDQGLSNDRHVSLLVMLHLE